MNISSILILNLQLLNDLSRPQIEASFMESAVLNMGYAMNSCSGRSAAIPHKRQSWILPYSMCNTFVKKCLPCTFQLIQKEISSILPVHRLHNGIICSSLALIEQLIVEHLNMRQRHLQQYAAGPKNSSRYTTACPEPNFIYYIYHGNVLH